MPNGQRRMDACLPQLPKEATHQWQFQRHHQVRHGCRTGSAAWTPACLSSLCSGIRDSGFGIRKSKSIAHRVRSYTSSSFSNTFPTAANANVPVTCVAAPNPPPHARFIASPPGGRVPHTVPSGCGYCTFCSE